MEELERRRDIRHLFEGLVAGALLVAADAAHAQDQVHWNTVGDWEIAVDTTIGNDCYAVAGWDGGTVVRIGPSSAKANHYLLIGNEDWFGLRAGQVYELHIRFDGDAPREMAAHGFQFRPGDTVYFHVETSDRSFLDDFRRRNQMEISHRGEVIDTIRLSGSGRALAEVSECQERVDRQGLPGTD